MTPLSFVFSECVELPQHLKYSYTTFMSLNKGKVLLMKNKQGKLL